MRATYILILPFSLFIYLLKLSVFWSEELKRVISFSLSISVFVIRNMFSNSLWKQLWCFMIWSWENSELNSFSYDHGVNANYFGCLFKKLYYLGPCPYPMISMSLPKELNLSESLSQELIFQKRWANFDDFVIFNKGHNL